MKKFFLKESEEVGMGFGLTSAVLTTIGLFTGLATSLDSEKAVISGILVIALVDALSDSMGMHLARESEKRIGTKDVWRTTFDTFLVKLIIALTFLVPVFMLDLHYALYTSFIWGAFLLALFSYHIAKRKKEKPLQVIFEHVLAGIIVILITYFLGIGINTLLN